MSIPNKRALPQGLSEHLISRTRAVKGSVVRGSILSAPSRFEAMVSLNIADSDVSLKLRIHSANNLIRARMVACKSLDTFPTSSIKAFGYSPGLSASLATAIWRRETKTSLDQGRSEALSDTGPTAPACIKEPWSSKGVPSSREGSAA